MKPRLSFTRVELEAIEEALGFIQAGDMGEIEDRIIRALERARVKVSGELQRRERKSVTGRGE